MKTKLLVLASVVTATLSIPAMAADNFVGAAYGNQQNHYDAGGGYSRDVNDPTYQLRAGTYINNEARLYLTYSFNNDQYTKQQMGLVSYDFLIPLTSDQKLNWFVGATAGMNHISPDNSVLSSSSSNRFVWGGQTGLQYKINPKLSTEVGYRYLKQDYSKASFSLDNSQQVYLGVDYRF
ncbi:porin family protein [Shewanella surugensis]|uniref:Porin family protein n=2 Tax=Shewanella surugensis TaxID=212020 RepID=A0ABT0LGE3_9GAMM|nr:porin family protein [Shewanella surugensis]